MKSLAEFQTCQLVNLSFTSCKITSISIWNIIFTYWPFFKLGVAIYSRDNICEFRLQQSAKCQKAGSVSRYLECSFCTRGLGTKNKPWSWIYQGRKHWWPTNIFMQWSSSNVRVRITKIWAGKLSTWYLQRRKIQINHWKTSDLVMVFIWKQFCFHYCHFILYWQYILNIKKLLHFSVSLPLNFFITKVPSYRNQSTDMQSKSMA